MAAKPLPSRLTPAAALPSLIFLGYASWRLWGFTLDDAFISLQYARNLAEGRGLVFNPGERVEGFSNPLWVFLLSALGAAGMPWVFTMKTAGFACALLTLLVLASTTKGLTGCATSNKLPKPIKAKRRPRTPKQKNAHGLLKDRASNGLSPWLFAMTPTVLAVTHPGMPYYAVAGLETPLFTLLLLLATVLQLKTEADGKYASRVYIPLSAAALTRPEGIIFIPLFFARRVWIAHRSGRVPEDRTNLPRRPIKEALIAGLASFPFAAYLIFRLAYFGDIFPNTFYAKPGTFFSNPSPAIEYAWRLIADHGAPLAFALIALVSLAVIASPMRSQARFLVGIAGAYTVFVLYTGGDWMAQYRLFQPLLPVVYLLPLMGLMGLPNGWPARVAIVLLCLTLIHARQAPRFWKELEENSAYDHAHRSDRNVEVALWLKENTSPGELLVTDEIGALGFYSGLLIVDQLGLIDKNIARILHDEGFNPYSSAPFSAQRRRVQSQIAKEIMKRHPRYMIVDYFAPPPSNDSPFNSELINLISMRELYSRMESDYDVIQSFSIMENPRKTFVIFERRQEGV